MLAEACSHITEPSHQALLLSHLLEGEPKGGKTVDARWLRQCLQCSTLVQQQVQQGLLALSNSWAAGEMPCWPCMHC